MEQFFFFYKNEKHLKTLTVKPVDYVLSTSQISARIYIFWSSVNVLGQALVDHQIWVELKTSNKKFGTNQSLVERLGSIKASSCAVWVKHGLSIPLFGREWFFISRVPMLGNLNLK